MLFNTIELLFILLCMYVCVWGRETETETKKEIETEQEDKQIGQNTKNCYIW